MSTYHYQQGCGWRDRFEADGDEAATALAQSRYHENAEYDGDEARLYRVTVVPDPDGPDFEDLELVHEWAGQDMIADPDGERGAFTDLSWHGVAGGN